MKLSLALALLPAASAFAPNAAFFQTVASAKSRTDDEREVSISIPLLASYLYLGTPMGVLSRMGHKINGPGNE